MKMSAVRIVLSIGIMAASAARASSDLSAQGRAISTDSTVTIEILDSFYPTVLNSSARLQFVDTATESYVVILTESKEDLVGWNLARHSMITIAQLLTGVDLPEVSGPTAVKVGGNPAVQYVVHGAIQGSRIGYVYTTVESPYNFATIITWTVGSRFKANEELLRRVTASVELLAPNPSVQDDIHAIAPGTWVWMSDEKGCNGLKQTFVISPDRKTMQIRHSEPIERGDGTKVSVTDYVIEDSAPLMLETYITDETRLTDDGKPVKWDLVAVGRNRLTWHRADWEEGAYTGMLQRCR